MMSSVIICLAGPTAAGKSAATLALAERWPIEIINVDSATIYRGMDIGTAKPSPAEQAEVPQHLLDIRDPVQAYSASEFCQDTFRLIDEIRARGRIPLLAGGTMMYYKALRDGLDDLPSADPQIRQTLEARAAIEGWPALHAELARVDPATAARLAPQDSQRIQRALEIFMLSGQPMSALLTRQGVPREAVGDASVRDDYARTGTVHGAVRTATPAATAAAHEWLTISLEPSDRLALHARIAARFSAMLSAGLLDEVARLRTRPDLHLGLPAIRCVGYRQLWEHLDGLSSFSQAHEQAVAATRQLAKRQITWLRAQPERHVIDCLSPHAVNDIIQTCAALLDRQDKINASSIRRQ